jgi:PRTRC genetic system protein B
VNTQFDLKLFQTLAPQPAPGPQIQAMLYFLDGHYLFRWWDKEKVTSKFVTANDLAAAFSHSEQDSGWLAPGIVRVGSSARGSWYVYSAPAQKVNISLSETETLTIPIPRTVMLGIDKDYYIWAMIEKYFEPKAAAYYAPFPNVYREGKICWGKNNPPKADSKSARGAWELFFGSLFNGDLANQKSKQHPADVRETLRGLAEVKVKAYPHNDLVHTNRAIGQLIEDEIGGK